MRIDGVSGGRITQGLILGRSLKVPDRGIEANWLPARDCSNSIEKNTLKSD